MQGTTERRLEEKERRRLEILDAAEAVAAIVGLDHFTMDQVARHARLSRALIYVYFRDKRELIIAICIRALEQLESRFADTALSHQSGLEQVDAMGRAYVGFAKEFPLRFEALAHFEAQAPSAEDDPIYEQCLAAGDRPIELVVAAIRKGLKDGSVRQDAGDPVRIGLSLWALTHGLIQLSALKGGSLQRVGVSADQLLDQGFQLALAALRSAEPPASTGGTSLSP
jgi:TetR/AcrR family transcriptional regulator